MFYILLLYLAGFTLTSFILKWSSKNPNKEEVRQIALLTVFWPVTYVIIATLLLLWAISTLLMPLVYIVEWLWEEGVIWLGKRILGRKKK